MFRFMTSHQVLPYAIQKLQQAGYQLVTLAECLDMAPYQSVQAPGTRDVSSYIFESQIPFLNPAYLSQPGTVKQAVVAV